MKIALTGLGLSGKTKLAHYLRDNSRFYVLNYTDILKNGLKRAFWEMGADITLDTISQDKQRFRRVLQELGTAVGFDTGFGVERIINEMRAQRNHYEHFVFDNVRFPAQWEILKMHGFVLAELDISYATQEKRALAKGMSLDQLNEMRQHPSEDGVSGELCLDGDRPTEEVASVLLRLAGLPVPVQPVQEVKPKLFVVDKAAS